MKFGLYRNQILLKAGQINVISPTKFLAPLFNFDLHGIEKTCVNVDTLVVIWTTGDLKSPTKM